MTRRTATVVGFAAILMCATLAALTAAVSQVPPFQLTALALALGGLVGAAGWIVRPGAARALIQPWPVWAVGIAGIFGYHLLYFTALRLAPPVEANLVNYLWPLLIVLFSALLPGERLKAHHLLGAGMGFAGAALVVAGSGLAIDPAHAPGYLAALGCALAWSGYSVLSRRFAAVPTDAVAGFCLAGAALSLIVHLMIETPVWPPGAAGWLALLALGLFPTGLAFYLWDIGMKRGDIQVLGAAAYATPVLSTLLLIAVGAGRFDATVAVALGLVTLGAVIASRDAFRRPGGPAR